MGTLVGTRWVFNAPLDADVRTPSGCMASARVVSLAANARDGS
jgi:hypothetical protein